MKVNWASGDGRCRASLTEAGTLRLYTKSKDDFGTEYWEELDKKEYGAYILKMVLREMFGGLEMSEIKEEKDESA